MKIGILPSIRETYKNQFEYSIDLRFKKFFFECFKKKIEIILIDEEQKLNDLNLIVFSGGNDLVKFSKKKCDLIRNSKNSTILRKAIKLKKNILSICYGSLFIANYFGAKITKTTKHKKNHKIFINNLFIKNNFIVNSFHNYKITKLNNKFNVIAYAFDQSIESFHYKEKKIFCVMWHPERFKKVQKLDVELIKKYIESK